MIHGMSDDFELHLDAWEIGYLEGMLSDRRSVAEEELLRKVQSVWDQGKIQ